MLSYLRALMIVMQAKDENGTLVQMLQDRDHGAWVIESGSASGVKKEQAEGTRIG